MKAFRLAVLVVNGIGFVTNLVALPVSIAAGNSVIAAFNAFFALVCLAAFGLMAREVVA